MSIGFKYNDGGRTAAGYKGMSGDCVTRAIAIAAELPYQTVYDLVNEVAAGERRKRGKSSARDGVYKHSQHKLLKSLGWTWTATMKIGQGCKTHLRAEELPQGRLLVSLSKHLTAVIDGVNHDTLPQDREGMRCVYGYWSKA